MLCHFQTYEFLLNDKNVSKSASFVKRLFDLFLGHVSNSLNFNHQWKLICKPFHDCWRNKFAQTYINRKVIQYTSKHLHSYRSKLVSIKTIWKGRNCNSLFSRNREICVFIQKSFVCFGKNKYKWIYL